MSATHQRSEVRGQGAGFLECGVQHRSGLNEPARNRLLRGLMDGSWKVFILCVWLLFLGIIESFAQWATQTVDLNSGWNAVYLEVQPEPRDCDTAFAGLPVESVWLWNRRFDSVQFIDDPENLTPGDPDWLTWVPADHEARSAINLYQLQVGSSYLIKLSDGATPVAWQVKGQPLIRHPQWLSNSLNLLGFQIDPENTPSFASFFASSPAHAGQSVFRLGANGQWQEIADPSATTLRRGEAFWVRTQGQSAYAGPLNVRTEQAGVLDYDRVLQEQTLEIKNDSAETRDVTIRKLASDLPPDGDFPELAGEVPLSYFHIDFPEGEYGWVPLTGDLSRELAPGEEWRVRLEVRRIDMDEFESTPNRPAAYQSLLEIVDNQGSRQLVAVAAKGLDDVVSGDVAANSLTGGSNHPRSGLWAGIATIDKVSQPSNVGQSEIPVATGSQFQFRLLVHVNPQGRPRLLQKVIQMWKNGTLKPDPDDPTRQVVEEPGRFVLLTDESLTPNYSGAVLRDGQPVGRRISSAAFGFSEPIDMVGDGDFGANTISCEVALDYDNPLNPFKHKYHPDHDNLDARFEDKLPEGFESFTIVRTVELEFQADDPDGFEIAGWGDSQLGGVYREAMSGVHQMTIHLEGTFRLHRASFVAELNDGQ